MRVLYSPFFGVRVRVSGIEIHCVKEPERCLLLIGSNSEDVFENHTQNNFLTKASKIQIKALT